MPVIYSADQTWVMAAEALVLREKDLEGSPCSLKHRNRGNEWHEIKFFFSRQSLGHGKNEGKNTITKIRKHRDSVETKITEQRTYSYIGK